MARWCAAGWEAAAGSRPLLPGGLAAPAQDEVVAEPEDAIRGARGPLEAGDQATPGSGVRDAVQQQVVPVERLSRKVHLGHQPAGEGGPEDGEMDVGRAPPVAGAVL